VFRAIEVLAPGRADEAAIRRMVEGEAPDDTPDALDRAWEEAPVTFGPEPPPTPTGLGACPATSAVVERFMNPGR
jgi:hypothetical protein